MKDDPSPKPAASTEPTTERARSAADDAAAVKAHMESLISTGEAALPDCEGKLPRGATHELSVTDEGEPAVVRRRFSAY